MTRDEVLELAKECNLIVNNAEHGIFIVALEKFAQLVIEKNKVPEVRNIWVDEYDRLVKEMKNE